jgi:hypothetical protein
VVEKPEVSISGELAERLCATQEMCAILGFRSAISLGKLERSGWIKRVSKNQWPLGATVQGYVKCLRESRHAHTSDATLKLREAQLRRIEAANEREARNVIRMTDALECVEIFGGAVITELCGLPARISRNLSDRSRIDEEVFNMRTRIAEKMKATAERFAGEAAE